MFFVVVLLGLTALDATAVATAGAGLAVAALRWGSTSLAAVAGGQAVLGPALLVGPWTAAVSVGAAAVALLCAAPPGPSAVPYGLAAAIVVAGPAATSPTRFAVRVGAALVGAVAALVIARQVAPARRRHVGVFAALVALAAALAP